MHRITWSAVIDVPFENVTLIEPSLFSAIGRHAVAVVDAAGR